MVFLAKLNQCIQSGRILSFILLAVLCILFPDPGTALDGISSQQRYESYSLPDTPIVSPDQESLTEDEEPEKYEEPPVSKTGTYFTSSLPFTTILEHHEPGAVSADLSLKMGAIGGIGYSLPRARFDVEGFFSQANVEEIRVGNLGNVGTLIGASPQEFVDPDASGTIQILGTFANAYSRFTIDWITPNSSIYAGAGIGFASVSIKEMNLSRDVDPNEILLEGDTIGIRDDGIPVGDFLADTTGDANNLGDLITNKSLTSENTVDTVDLSNVDAQLGTGVIDANGGINLSLFQNNIGNCNAHDELHGVQIPGPDDATNTYAQCIEPNPVAPLELINAPLEDFTAKRFGVNIDANIAKENINDSEPNNNYLLARLGEEKFTDLCPRGNGGSAEPPQAESGGFFSDEARDQPTPIHNITLCQHRGKPSVTASVRGNSFVDGIRSLNGRSINTIVNPPQRIRLSIPNLPEIPKELLSLDQGDIVPAFQFKFGLEAQLFKSIIFNAGYRFLQTDDPTFTTKTGMTIETEGAKVHMFETGIIAYF